MRESEESTALVVPVECAQNIRCKLEKLNLWNSTYKLKKLGDSGQVAIPIDISKGNISAISDIWPDFKIARIYLPISKKINIKQNSQTAVLQSEIKQLLNKYGISVKLLDEVPSKWERHEDLIIIPAHAFSSPEWSLIGSNLWQVIAKCLACKRLARHSAVADNGFRSSKVTMLLGDNGEVTHVDNGIKYAYDVTKCMFSAGNITEKIRVANLDCRKETVVDLYAGIGYFTLPYLIHAKAHHVHACEWNPDAAVVLKHNLLINGVSDRCTVHEGDNRLLRLPPLADRVNLGLIPSSEDGWPIAVQVLKECGGILHIHGNVTTSHQKRVVSKTDGHACGLHQWRDKKNMPSAKKDDGHLHSLCQEKEMNSAAENSGKITSRQEKKIGNVLTAEKCAGNILEPGLQRENNIPKAKQGIDNVKEDSDSLCKNCMHLRTFTEAKGVSGSHFVNNAEVVSSGLQDIVLKDSLEMTPEDISSCLLNGVNLKEADLSLQHAYSNLQQTDARLGHTESILKQTDQILQQAEQNVQQIYTESLTNASKQQVCKHNSESENMKLFPLDNNEAADAMTSDGNSLRNLSNATYIASEHDLYVTCHKKSGKEKILLACQEWSCYVQGKIKSYLEEKKGGTWTVKELHIEVVKSYAPHIVHVVLDLECRPMVCMEDLN